MTYSVIAAIYGLEERHGITALVMELIEGDHLSERVAKGAIPLLTRWPPDAQGSWSQPLM